MPNIQTTLAAMHRPKLLIRAARAGIQNYRRDQYVKNIAGAANKYGAQLLDSLLAEETRLNDCRLEGDASYSIQKHIIVMTALLAEANRPLAPAMEYKMAA